MRRALAAAAGQSTVEVVALLPVLAGVVLGAAQLLSAGLAREQAGTAAQAAAMALLQDEDPRAAAREAVPGWSRERVAVRVRGRAVEVRLRPPAFMPGTAGSLTATVTAHAGPEAGG